MELVTFQVEKNHCSNLGCLFMHVSVVTFTSTHLTFARPFHGRITMLYCLSCLGARIPSHLLKSHVHHISVSVSHFDNGLDISVRVIFSHSPAAIRMEIFSIIKLNSL